MKNSSVTFVVKWQGIMPLACSAVSGCTVTVTVWALLRHYGSVACLVIITYGIMCETVLNLMRSVYKWQISMVITKDICVNMHNKM